MIEGEMREYLNNPDRQVSGGEVLVVREDLEAWAARVEALGHVEEKKARFLEAALGVAEAYVRCANTDEYGPKLMAMVTLYRRLQGNPDVPGEVRIAGRYLVEAGKSGT